MVENWQNFANLALPGDLVPLYQLVGGKIGPKEEKNII